jgi:hypothetical protein
MFIPAVQGGHAINDITLDITSNTADVNILSLATAAGYNAGTDTTAIILNVASGVDITATSGNPGITTGALNAGSNLTINIEGSVCGANGANNASSGGAGGAGTDAIKFDISSGTGTYEVIIASGSTVGAGSGGGGGGGAGGSAGARLTAVFDGKGVLSCQSPSQYGSAGSQGANGSGGTACRAQAGNAGSTGSSGGYPGGPCSITVGAGSGSAGGAGGSPGKAVNFNGNTVNVTNNGTLYGATS